MSSKFYPLEIPPGVVSTATKKMRSSNWAQCNMMRWSEGQLSPMGGQAQFSHVVGGVETYAFASRCKAIHPWYGLDGVLHIAYLCEQHLYVDTAGVLTDISPTPALDGPAPLTVGGYGDGLYSAETYGTPRSTPSTILPIDKVPDAWCLDNFGQVLLAMTSPDGRLLQWDPTVGGAATIVAGAPHGRCFVVTPERFVQIFGATQDGTVDGGSFRRFAWCDQENFHAWDFANVTSQAGFLDIEPGSPIITAVSTKNGTLFWTSKRAYLSQFLGLPYVYNYQQLGEGSTPWSPESTAVTASMTLWMSQQGLFSFDGTAISPIACPIRSWIDDDIDIVNVREQACAVHVATFNEFWWFYPQDGQAYNTRAIIYNYREGWFSQARMRRSAGVAATYSAHTIMADGLIAYQHELPNGQYADADLPFAETFDLNLTTGSRLITIKQLIPDIEGDDISNLRYSLFYRNSRSVGALEQQSAPQPVRSDGYVDFRVTGRDVRMKIEVAGPLVASFTLGQHLFDGAPRGDR